MMIAWTDTSSAEVIRRTLKIRFHGESSRDSHSLSFTPESWSGKRGEVGRERHLLKQLCTRRSVSARELWKSAPRVGR